MTSLPELSNRYSHPLEAIPGFRRIPHSIPRDLFYTLLMCIAVTITFSFITLLNVPTQRLSTLLYRNFVFSLCIAYSVHILSAVGHRVVVAWFDDPAHRNRWIAGIGSSIIGGVLGYALAAHLVDVSFRMWGGMIIAVVWMTALVSGLVMAQRRRVMAELAYERERNARIEAERLTTASRLKLLQAQIEPHFLFNTLAGVSSLIESDPQAARKMVDELCVFLRAALDSTRRATATLQHELEVIEAYLSVLKARMGSRLEYRIDVPGELLPTEVPSMILQPLVENAIEHGIDSRLEGGRIEIRVHRVGDTLQLTVQDNGEGFKANARDNVGMGTVRERLQVLFDTRAALRVLRQDGWTKVIVELPSGT